MRHARGKQGSPWDSGPAQRLYAKRGYIPDGRGAYQGQHTLKQGETVTVDHDLLLWLTKDLEDFQETP